MGLKMGGFRWNLPVTGVSVFMILNVDKEKINLRKGFIWNVEEQVK